MIEIIKKYCLEGMATSAHFQKHSKEQVVSEYFNGKLKAFDEIFGLIAEHELTEGKCLAVKDRVE